jgi:cephalosporin-C deacetylase-like acetyl esterase
MIRIWLALILLAPSQFAQESLRVTSGLENMVDAYLTGIAQRLWEARSAEVAAIGSRAQVLQRQEYIRGKLLEEIGGFPQRTPLHPRITGTLQRSGYRVEKLIFESQPRYYVTANVYVPTVGTPPFPAVLGASGHDEESKADPDYQRVWISLAKRGFLVLAYDPPAQGERSEDVDPKTSRRRRIAEHIMVGAPCMLTGTNFARHEIWDGIRAVDYLVSRKDVDPKRIGVVGHSGGGTQTAYLMALEPRLVAATPTCYITSWERLWGALGPQDAEQTIDGFLKDGLGFGDYLIAFAPRPVRVASAIRDVFPIDGTRATVAEARRIYELLGAGDRIDLAENDDEHRWARPLREALYRWMQKWLNGRDDDGVEAPFDVEPPQTLHCTRTGMVVTSLKCETTQSLNQALAERLYRRRSALQTSGASELRSLIATRIQTAEVGDAVPAWTNHGDVRRDHCRVEKIALETEPGITVPSLVFVPAGDAPRRSAVLYVDSAGKGVGDDVEALVSAGHIVMAADLRGWGESLTAQKPIIYDGTWLTPFRALLLGKNMTGMQVFDLRRALTYLVSRADVDASRVRVLGKGNAGVIALYAAALDPRIRGAACEGAVPSYMAIVRAKHNRNMVELLVPGVLKAFDLADVAALIAPRTLWIVAARDPAGETLAAAQCAREYTPTARAYRASSHAGNFRVIDRPAHQPFAKTYARWLSN